MTTTFRMMTEAKMIILAYELFTFYLDFLV